MCEWGIFVLEMPIVKHRTNEGCLSLEFISALFVLFANNNNKTDSTVWRNIQMCSCNYLCCRKSVDISYSGCVIAALFTQHAMGVRLIAIRSLPPSIIFFHVIRKRA
jgi:hypothetical protein